MARCGDLHIGQSHSNCARRLNEALVPHPDLPMCAIGIMTSFRPPWWSASGANTVLSPQRRDTYLLKWGDSPPSQDPALVWAANSMAYLPHGQGVGSCGGVAAT